MKTVWISWSLVVLLLITSTYGDVQFRSLLERNLTKLLADNSPCVDEFIRLSSIDLTTRFSRELLAIACAKKTKWQNQADRRLLLLSDPGGTADGLVTKPQLEWLNSIRNCTDLTTCLCTTASCASDSTPLDTNDNSTQKRQKRQRTRPAQVRTFY